MKKITLDELLNWNPCKEYTKERILEISKGKTSLTPLEISKLKIPYSDRLWVLLRPGVLGEKNYIEIGNKIADRAVKKYCLKCGDKEIEEWAKDWLSGKDRTEESALAGFVPFNKTTAAICIVRGAAASVAYAAASANASSVFYFVWTASDYYAACVGYATSNDIDCSTERKWQLNLIKKHL